MIKLKLVAVGSVKEAYYRNKIQEFVSEIKKRFAIEIVELRDETIPKNAGESILADIKRREGERILAQLSRADYVIALCIEGKLTGSKELKELLERASERTEGRVVFIIGGSLGIYDAVTRRADYKMSFSLMTFPHQLMRVMLLEQLAHQI